MTVNVLERLMGFEADYTLGLWPQRTRKADPAGFKEARVDMLNDTADPLCVAFVLGELAFSWGLVDEPVNVTDLAWGAVQLRPGTAAPVLARIDGEVGLKEGEVSLTEVLRWLMGQQTAAGGAIKNLKGAPHALGHWQEVPAELFRWRTVLSVP